MDKLRAFVEHFQREASWLADVIHAGAEAGVASNAEDVFNELIGEADQALSETS